MIKESCNLHEMGSDDRRKPIKLILSVNYDILYLLGKGHDWSDMNNIVQIFVMGLALISGCKLKNTKSESQATLHLGSSQPFIPGTFHEFDGSIFEFFIPYENIFAFHCIRIDNKPICGLQSEIQEKINLINSRELARATFNTRLSEVGARSVCWLRNGAIIAGIVVGGYIFASFALAHTAAFFDTLVASSIGTLARFRPLVVFARQSLTSLVFRWRSHAILRYFTVGSKLIQRQVIGSLTGVHIQTSVRTVTGLTAFAPVGVGDLLVIGGSTAALGYQIFSINTSGGFLGQVTCAIEYMQE